MQLTHYKMNVFDYFFKETKDLDKDFVIGNKETISYQDLYKNSLKVASFLKEEVGSDQNILLIKQNSVFFITAYLGIMKSGNVCVPLDYSIEKENFSFIKNLSESKAIFYDKKLALKLDISGLNITVDEVDFKNILKNQKVYKNDLDFDSEQLAQIIFTSGSTGKPKGVMLSHQNLISNTNSIIDYLKLTSEDIQMIVLPFYYCFGLSLLHTHLKVGGQVVLNNTFMFLGTVITGLKKYKCTGFSGVPSHYQMLLKKSKSFKITNFPELRYVTQAGGKLHNVFIEEFVKSFPTIDFVVMYGQTEATARLSYLPAELVIKKLGSIGKAIPGVELDIIDKKGKVVPNGEVGEIIAKGGNIMNGYYKDTNGTNEALKDGWLYTGDLAKKDDDGFITIVAREKEIIKVGGKRVSPKEIEEVILSVSNVVDCTIKGVDDDILGEALKAIVVVDQFDKKDQIKNEILLQCKDRLALYKIPQRFEFLNKMVVKSTGKKKIS